MQSDHPVTCISAASAAGIHAYFDLCPERPDERWVVYFQFCGTVPGPGQLVVTDRTGWERHPVGAPCQGSAHVGVRQQWVDNHHVAYSANDQTSTTYIASLDDGALRQVPGVLRMFAPARQCGLGTAPSGTTALGDSVYAIDVARAERRRLFGWEEVAALHPLRSSFDARALPAFKHSKWAPDGSGFLVVFSNVRALRSHPEAAEITRIKSLLVAEADGSNLRYLAEFGHHPLWSPDSTFIAAVDHHPNGGKGLTRYPLDGTPPHPLVPQMAGVHASLSPDGTQVVVDVLGKTAWTQPGEGALLLYEVATGQPRVLATFGLPDTTHQTGCHPHPVWSRNGRRIYFNAADDGVPRLFAVELC